MSFESWIATKMYRHNDHKRDAKLVLPKDVTVERDLSYLDDRKKSHLFDLYVPRGREEFSLPVIVNIHGGGYFYGNKELYQHYCASLAKQGYRVISFNYTLAPKGKFPTQLKEINDMFAWIKGHNERYHLDLNNLFAIGDSAGAQLLSQYVALLLDKEYQSLFPEIQFVEGLQFRGLVLACGLFDVRTCDSFTKDRFGKAVLKDYLGKGGLTNEETVKRLDVLPHIHENYPPCYILTSQYDFIRTQSEHFDRHLTEKKVEHEFHSFGKEGEQFYDHDFHLKMGDKRVQEANADQARFLKEHQKDGYADLSLDVSALLGH